jgi:HEPN domain-containing protein
MKYNFFLIFELMDKQVKYWIALSDYHLETADAMLKTRRYLYVGFMCHQTIEKAFKANYTKAKTETAPYSHSLSYLANKNGFYELFQKVLLRRFD